MRVFYKRPVPHRADRSRRVRLSYFKGIDERAAEDTLPCGFTSKCVGFRIKDGRLFNGYGKKERVEVAGWEKPLYIADQLSETGKLFTYRSGNDTILFTADVSDGNKLKYVKLESGDCTWRSEFVEGVSAEGDGAMCIYNDKDALIIPRNGKGFFIYDGNRTVSVDANISADIFCVHSERIFAANSKEGYTLHFSDDSAPVNWNISIDEGGKIFLDTSEGRIVKLMSFNNNLYVFREYCVYRLTAYGDQRDFILKKVCDLTGRLYKDTVALGGGAIYFVTTAGAYAFDGSGATEILGNIERTLSRADESACACFNDGKYYVSLPSYAGKWRVAVYDTSDGQTAVSDMRADRLVTYRNGMLSAVIAYDASNRKFGFITDDGEIFGKRMQKEWESGRVTFGRPDKCKILKALGVTRSAPYRIGITADGKSYREITVSGRERYVPLGIVGYEFLFTVRSDIDCGEGIAPPYVYAEV